MPVINQPDKLFEICNDFTNSYLMNLIINISSSSDLEWKLCLVQEYILQNLSAHLIDNLLQTVEPLSQMDNNQKLMLLKLLMHPSMAILSTRFRLPYQDYFYEVRLKDLRKLVVLNLNMVCTDEILEAVGDNCPLLEVALVMSKMSCVKKRIRRELNALKIKFYVSDNGLKHLHKCKFLKTIVMNRLIPSNCAGGKISHEGIRKLLYALPHIQFISYNDMGLVLKKDVNVEDKFNLLHLHDTHTYPEHIDAFVKHCPKLRSLCLMLPPTTIQSSIPNDCLFKLAESELKLTSLALRLFPINHSFCEFLSVKGQYLKNLSVSNNITITAQTIFLIGLHCPYIEFLEVNLALSDDFDEENYRSSSRSAVNGEMFAHLQSLIIVGSKWEPEIVIPLCLNNAIHLKHLILVNKNYFTMIDKVLLKLFDNNQLVNLTSASLLDGFCVTQNTLVKLVLAMKSLERIIVTRASGYKDHLEKMKTDNNLNLFVETNCMIENDVRNYNKCLCNYWQISCTQKSLISFF